MRRILATLVIVNSCVAVVFACNSFSGSNGPEEESDATATSDAVSADGSATPALDATSGAEAGSVVATCQDYDAATDLAPSGNLAQYTCPTADGGVVTGVNLLADNQNCGRCGHACADGQCDGNGSCTEVVFLAVAGVSDSRIAKITDGTLYLVITNPDTEVLSTPTSVPDASDAFGPLDAAYPNGAASYAVAADDQIYVRLFLDTLAIPFDGGTFRRLDTAAATVRALAVDPNRLYLAEAADNLRILFKDGGADNSFQNQLGIADLATAPDGSVMFYIARTAVDAGGVTSDGSPSGLRAGSLYRYVPSTRALTNMWDFDANTFAPNSLVVTDGINVYFADASGNIWALDAHAPPSTPRSISHAPTLGRSIFALAQSADRIYFFSGPAGQVGNGDWDIVSVSKCGGPDVILRANVPTAPVRTYDPYQPVVDGQWLYWSNSASVLRIAR